MNFACEFCSALYFRGWETIFIQAEEISVRMGRSHSIFSRACSAKNVYRHSQQKMVLSGNLFQVKYLLLDLIAYLCISELQLHFLLCSLNFWFFLHALLITFANLSKVAVVHLLFHLFLLVFYQKELENPHKTQQSLYTAEYIIKRVL